MTESSLLRGVACVLFLHAVAVAPADGGERRFSFAPHLDLERTEPTLVLGEVLVEGRTVRIEGADSARVIEAFRFDWGDGRTSEGWFPATHTYAEADRNYPVTVTASYPTGTHTARTEARFLPPRYEFRRVESVPRRVSIPREMVELATTMPGYDPSDGVTCFRDEEITPIPREVIEYVLDVGHHLQMDLCNRDVARPATRRVVVLKQTGLAGCASLWYSDPVAMACHPCYLRDDVGFSSLLHELAHNLTLNSPAKYRFGGKTDGPMNTIVSETLANIFQHATIHEILNTPGHYGLSEDVCRALEESGVQSIAVVREAHRAYRADPDRYTTYDDPDTERDDTFDTFLTVAYVFCDLAERRGEYRGPLKRMMRLLQTFSGSDHARFQQRENEPFRATFLVAAMSWGFREDLRERFRELRFPVSDKLYAKLLARVSHR
jgi:hypothetical protein